MKIHRSKEWWLAKGQQEGESMIAAGLLACDPAPQVSFTPEIVRPADETRIAFGRFVNLMRRKKGFSIEKLADEATLDIGELVCIEEDLDFTPEPRTVYQLARTFGVPQQRLMQMAGLIIKNDTPFHQAAVRFAARSESNEKLNVEEKAALSAFIEVLSGKQDPEGTP